MPTLEALVWVCQQNSPFPPTQNALKGEIYPDSLKVDLQLTQLFAAAHVYMQHLKHWA